MKFVQKIKALREKGSAANNEEKQPLEDLLVDVEELGIITGGGGNYFDRYFENNQSSTSLGQQGQTPPALTVAQKTLAENTSNLQFYNYNSSSNNYTTVNNSTNMGTNGSVHTNNNLGGDIQINK